MSEVNMGLDFVSLYLHDDRKKADKDRNFVNTDNTETQESKEPTFLDKLYANFGTKPEEIKADDEAERKAKEMNLLGNKKWVPVTVNSNSKFEVSQLSPEQLQKNKQILDEIIEKLKI